MRLHSIYNSREEGSDTVKTLQGNVLSRHTRSQMVFSPRSCMIKTLPISFIIYHWLLSPLLGFGRYFQFLDAIHNLLRLLKRVSASR
jgi:hypothetical protein